MKENHLKSPRHLRFTMGGYGGECLDIESKVDAVHVRHAPYAYAWNDQLVIVPAPAAWSRFWRTVKRAGVWQWRPRYIDHGVMDGTQWSLALTNKGCSVICNGSNAYPGAKGPSYGHNSAFARFLRAVRALAGVETIR